MFLDGSGIPQEYRKSNIAFLLIRPGRFATLNLTWGRGREEERQRGREEERKRGREEERKRGREVEIEETGSK